MKNTDYTEFGKIYKRVMDIELVLKGKQPDYLIVQHMEPDHSANIMNFLKVYPQTIVVGNCKTFNMMEQFFNSLSEKTLTVKKMRELLQADIISTKNGIESKMEQK